MGYLNENVALIVVLLFTIMYMMSVRQVEYFSGEFNRLERGGYDLNISNMEAARKSIESIIQSFKSSNKLETWMINGLSDSFNMAVKAAINLVKLDFYQSIKVSHIEKKVLVLNNVDKYLDEVYQHKMTINNSGIPKAVVDKITYIPPSDKPNLSTGLIAFNKAYEDLLKRLQGTEENIMDIKRAGLDLADQWVHFIDIVSRDYIIHGVPSSPAMKNGFAIINETAQKTLEILGLANSR